jgi:ABC-type multidrug transport system fused ATPase/permease subunit
LNYQCGLIFTFGISILYIFEFIKIKVNLKYIEILKDLTEKFNSKVNENYRGIKDIKGLGIKEQTIFGTDSISRKISDAQIKKDRLLALLSRCKTYAQYSVEAVLILYAVGVLIPNNEITVIILLTIVNYSYFMYDLVGYIAKIKDYFVRGDYKAERILQILDDVNIETFGDCGKLDSYSIKINDLSYSYNDGFNNDDILKNINLTIPEKSATVFVGVSGSGKTTLFGLLSRLLHCGDNTIFIGGIDINNLSEDCLRDNLCIVNQEPFLMNDTVLNNIKIVKPFAGLDEVYAACRKAHIFDEINDFENGFDTVVSENGNNLSGGQKQRISIARAILKNSGILLFDEPTSSLDKNNQELFLETIRELKNDKTILLIAHKLVDYSDFDNVYELRQGNLYIEK